MSDLADRLQAAVGNRYSVDRELGRGGMSLVFLARDTKHQRAVAIKVLRPEVAAALGSERFLREIQVAAGLQHPHILPLYDSGEAAGLVYYVMPYIEGESLRERLGREKRMPVGASIEIARHVATALAYAHSHGIVHRDIKPENILLAGGEPVVADFGIARAISAAGAERLTGTGFAIGTPAYMSPEQSIAASDVDGRSDIYSLGCVLYEMLAGEPPFTGPTVESVMHQHLAADPRPVTLLRPAVPAAVERVLERALAKTPADRPPTAIEFAEALIEVPGPQEGRSIAVLPFVNLSAEKEDEYFSDGMTDELTDALAKLEGLRVASRTSAFAFKGTSQDIRSIGQRLNVGAVLEGAVRRAGTRLRLTARLSNVADGFQMWSETYERELRDVFAIQDDISRAIVDALQLRLRDREARSLVRPATEDLAAYHMYLKGRYLLNRRTESSLQKAIAYFEQAIEQDPAYALAHAGLADVLTVAGTAGYGTEALQETLGRARAAAQRALALDDTLAEAHASLGWVRCRLDWDWGAAEAEFRRAIALNSNNATAHHWYAMYLSAMGRPSEAIAEIHRALDLDPLSLIVNSAAGRVFHFAGRAEQAIEQYRRTLELDPQFAQAHFDLGLAYLRQGRVEEACVEIGEAVGLSGGRPITRVILGYAHAVAGRREEAQRMLEELKGQQHLSSQYLVYLYIGLGDKDRAFEHLEAAYKERAGLLVYLKVEPIFDSLRSDPRFTDLLRRMGL